MAVKHSSVVHEKMSVGGKWWLPCSPDRVVHGVLEGSESEGFVLKTSELLNEPEDFVTYFGSANDDSHKIIHGRTRIGPITICTAFATRQSIRLNEPDLSDVHYYCRLVLKGHLFSESDEARFTKLRVKFSHLCEYVDARVFTCKPNESFQEFRIDLAFPKNILLYRGSVFSVSLGFSFNPPGFRAGQNKLAVEWEPYFLIESADGTLSLDGDGENTYVSIIRAINHFLMLVTGAPIFHFDVAGYLPNAADDTDELTKAKRVLPIEVYGEHDIPLSRYDMRRAFVPWNQVAANSQVYFGNWFAACGGLPGPIDLFTGSLRRGNSYSAERFLNVVMAAEGIHRYFFAASGEPSEDHVRKVTTICESIPNQYRKWLAGELTYSHEPSLRRRLKDLAHLFVDTFDWLIGADGSQHSRKNRRSKVIGEIADSRNSLAHALPVEGGDLGSRYYHFTELLELLLSMCLLREVGFEVTTIHEIVTRNYFRQQVRNRIHDFFRDELNSEETQVIPTTTPLDPPATGDRILADEG